MAISTSDFDKIWASSSPLTPYSFSDANYEEGWNFVGATPPARQMWDSYMKWSDEKQQWIVNNFLPLSGGTMTGAITLNNVSKSFVTGYSNGFYASAEENSVSNRSFFALYSNADGNGFKLRAGNGSTTKDLDGKPNGTLTWNGKNVLTDNVQTINNLTQVITYNSGYSNRGGTLHLIAGFLVMLKIGVNFTNAVSANTSVTVGTIASEYRPPNDAFGGGGDSLVAIASDGSIAIRPLVNKGADSWAWATILYTLI